jgi:hypothetical protein
MIYLDKYFLQNILVEDSQEISEKGGDDRAPQKKGEWKSIDRRENFKKGVNL